MASNATIPRRGDQVSFRVRDIYLPGPVEFVESLDPDTEVLGCIVGFSDSGSSPGAFAIVQTGERRKVVVPINSLSPVQKSFVSKPATPRRRKTA
jgi:hypothetical protein